MQGLHELAKRVAKHSGMQQAAFSHTEVCDHLGHEWVSKVVLDVMPGCPIPPCCAHGEARETLNQTSCYSTAGGPAGGSAVGGRFAAAEPARDDECVPDPWQLRGHRVRQTEVLDSNGDQVDALSVVLSVGSMSLSRTELKLPDACCWITAKANLGQARRTYTYFRKGKTSVPWRRA